MARHRLFVALRPPVEARRALLGAMGGVAAARWQSDEQLHCTLRFLDEVDGHVAEDVAHALQGVGARAIDAEIGGLGCFDRRGVVDTLWVGVGPLAAMRALHDKIERLLAAVGVAADPRAYCPHITLARFGRAGAPPADIALRLPPPPRLRVRLDDLRLYESILTRDGARYETVARIRLA